MQISAGGHLIYRIGAIYGTVLSKLQSEWERVGITKKDILSHRSLPHYRIAAIVKRNVKQQKGRDYGKDFDRVYN